MWLSLTCWILSQTIIWFLYYWGDRKNPGYESYNEQTRQHIIPTELVQNYDRIEVSIKKRQDKSFSAGVFLDPADFMMCTFRPGSREFVPYTTTIKIGVITYRLSNNIDSVNIKGIIDYKGYCLTLTPQDHTDLYTDIRVAYVKNNDFRTAHLLLALVCTLVHLIA